MIQENRAKKSEYDQFWNYPYSNITFFRGSKGDVTGNNYGKGDREGILNLSPYSKKINILTETTGL